MLSSVGAGAGVRRPSRPGCPPVPTPGKRPPPPREWRGSSRGRGWSAAGRRRSLGCRAVTTTAPPVVQIAEELAPSVLEVLGRDVEIRHVDGADRAALLPALADAAAVMIRSATQIDAEALAAAPKLKVVT